MVIPFQPRVGSGAVRIGPLRFLTGPEVVKAVPTQGLDCFVS